MLSGTTPGRTVTRETERPPDEGEVLLIDKPPGWTSFDVVNKIRRGLRVRRAGHAGTLDPLATGLLIVCTGRRTRDVQHSFFVPHFRVKQDSLPGQVIPMWFQADEKGEYEFLCAELCGWGHYKMKARFVAKPEEEYIDYLRELTKQQNYDGVKEAPAQ